MRLLINLLETISVTLPKALEPPKTEKSVFVRNSSIRLSDARTRCSIRETEPDPSKVITTAGVVVTATAAAVEGTTEIFTH